MKNNYLCVTIGPIIKTLSMARKPRELWSASYMFSCLMKELRIAFINSEKTNILSPAEVQEKGVVNNSQESEIKVGLYPDRLFCRIIDESFDYVGLIQTVKAAFANKLNISENYFNIYSIEEAAENDGEAIQKLNLKMDFLELQNKSLNKEEEKEVRNLIFKKTNSPLFGNKFKINNIAKIASIHLEQTDFEKYKNCGDEDEDDFMIKLKKSFSHQFKTTHKYICVINADGDNIGTIINSLKNDQIKQLSKSLLSFGEKACTTIDDFKGLPIYAGGDDLLFIAPVISLGKDNKIQTIFDLVKQIDEIFEETGIKEFTGKDENGNILTPSMSFGISISYYKYPLYESLEISRNLLFQVAKDIKPEKNAIAWSLQKGSGSTVNAKFSKSNYIYNKFEELLSEIQIPKDDIKERNMKNLVSAVPHKIRECEALLGLFLGSENVDIRLDAFFEKTLEYSSKNREEKKYLDAVKKLLIALHKSCNNNIKDTITNAYALLRTAKFIKGLEEDKDE